MTWLDIKVTTLQKMSAISGDSITNDEATTDFIKAMPAAANEGLQRLVTAGKYIEKSIVIEQDGTDTGLVKKYNLEELAEDFYSLDGRKVYFEDAENYGETREFAIEGRTIFVLPATAAGKWTIYYNAYPAEIGVDVVDSYVLPLDPELAVLLPLYIASQLYKDDDISIATVYRNEFEQGIAAVISGVAKDPGKERFTSKKGWV